MTAWTDATIDAFLKLSTCNVSDALDRLRLRGAPHGLRPLWPGCRKIVGRAMTLKLVPHGAESPVLGTLAAIKDAQPGDVMVIDHGGRMDVNSWGGIASFAASQRGIVGVVVDGVTRDVDEMRALGFPAYGRGVIQQSIRNRCAYGGHGVDVQLAGVAVRRGDLVVADNGVVVVSAARITQVLRVAQACFDGEEQIKAWIAAGVDPIDAHERAAYDQMTDDPAS